MMAEEQVLKAKKLMIVIKRKKGRRLAHVCVG
jgi:hypothetical protein